MRLVFHPVIDVEQALHLRMGALKRLLKPLEAVKGMTQVQMLQYLDQARERGIRFIAIAECECFCPQRGCPGHRPLHSLAPTRIRSAKRDATLPAKFSNTHPDAS